MRTENFVDYHVEWGKLLHGEGLRGIFKQLSGEVCLQMGHFRELLFSYSHYNEYLGDDPFQRQDQLQAT